MPDTTLKQAIKEAYASVYPGGVVELLTIEIRHASFTTPIRCVVDGQAWTLTLEDTAPVDAGAAVSFEPYPFEVTRPSVEENALPELAIAITNVTGEIEDQVRAAAYSGTKAQVTFRVYLSTDTSGPQNDPPMHLTITHIEADDFRVTARASFADIANKQFPGEDYTAARFPGLVR
jgi:hypothetical protein